MSTLLYAFFLSISLGVTMSVSKKIEIEFEEISEDELEELKKKLEEAMNGETETVAEIINDNKDKKIIIHR